MSKITPQDDCPPSDDGETNVTLTLEHRGIIMALVHDFAVDCQFARRNPFAEIFDAVALGLDQTTIGHAYSLARKTNDLLKESAKEDRELLREAKRDRLEREKRARKAKPRPTPQYPRDSKGKFVPRGNTQIA